MKSIYFSVNIKKCISLYLYSLFIHVFEYWVHSTLIPETFFSLAFYSDYISSEILQVL